MKKCGQFTIFRSTEAHISILIHYINIHLLKEFVNPLFSFQRNFFFHFFTIEMLFLFDGRKILFFLQKVLAFYFHLCYNTFCQITDMPLGV